LPIVGEAASPVCFLFKVPAAGVVAVDIVGEVEGMVDACVCWDCCGIVFGGCFSGELTPVGVVFGGELSDAELIGVEPGGNA